MLFPSLRQILRADELDALGAQLLVRENALFGVGGAGRKLVEVSQLESSLGIADLMRATPAEFQ